MNYYTGNAVYDALAEEPAHSFKWMVGSGAILVYADAAAIPRLMVMACSQCSPPTASQSHLFQKMGTMFGLPTLFVLFDAYTEQLKHITCGTQLHNVRVITMSDYMKKLNEFGLTARNGRSKKSFNGAAGSTYHQWMHKNVGSLGGTDIDLVRVDPHGTPVELIELKRSYIDLHNWKPFREDFYNFNVMRVLCDRADLPCTIAYNHYPYDSNGHRTDKISSFAIFDYSARDTYRGLGYFSYADFRDGVYLNQPTGLRSRRVL